MPEPGAAPDERLAATIAAAFAGIAPRHTRRFTTGSMHYVFEASFDHRPPVVLRIAGAHGKSAMTGASLLSHRLRPLGVPLPAILAEDLAAPHPYLVLERLPGGDLGDVVGGLPLERLDVIAKAVATAQATLAGQLSAGRYGYAVEASEAPYFRWSDVISASLRRSRERIENAALFDPAHAAAMATLIDAARPELDAQPATPFLHDTTTKNVIVTPEGHLSGIVDVDDLCFGDPRLAPALTLAALRNLGVAGSYVEAWQRHAGLSGDRLFRLYVALSLLDFMSEHGQRFNGNETVSTPEARQRLLILFTDAMRQAAGGVV